MKTLLWTGPRQLIITEQQKPKPAPGEVILKVSKVGICGSDLSGYLGENNLRKPPLIMGHEFSGLVTDMSDDVEGLSPGQLVTVNPLLSCGNCLHCLKGQRQLCPQRKIIGIHRPGAFSEYVAVPANACHKVNNDVFGALVEPLACCVRANERADIRMNDDVLVFGAGIIGLMSLRIAQIRGARRRMIVDPNPLRLEKAKLWGATHIFNPSDCEITHEILRINTEGVDKVIDAVGLPVTRKQAISVVKNGGVVVFVGLHCDETAVPGNSIVRKEIQISGSFCYSDMDFLNAIELLNNQVITPDTAWLDIRPLEEGKASFDEQIDGSAPFSKIILQP